MKAIIIAFVRFLNGFHRPSKAKNIRLLRQRGEDITTSFTIREATASDIPTLAALHVKTWADTYWMVKHPPTFQIREWQWREQFTVKDDSWFCFVIENPKGELIGFAKGVRHNDPDIPGYSGELSKIYLLREYQGLGLGRRLIIQVARRFLSQGIHTMSLFAEATNPTVGFYKAMGGKRTGGPSSGNYKWSDLQKLAILGHGLL